MTGEQYAKAGNIDAGRGVMHSRRQVVSSQAGGAPGTASLLSPQDIEALRKSLGTCTYVCTVRWTLSSACVTVLYHSIKIPLDRLPGLFFFLIFFVFLLPRTLKLK